MKRSTPSTIAALSACAVLAGCSSAPADSAPPVVRISEAAKPSVSHPLKQVLPTGDELTTTLGVGPGFTGQLVVGGADMLLQGVGESEATPIECVSAGYRLQKVVYAASPVREVASQSWAEAASTARRCPGSSEQSNSRRPTTHRGSSPHRPTSGGGATARRWSCTSRNTGPTG